MTNRPNNYRVKLFSQPTADDGDGFTYRIDLRNHLKIQNHATLIDTDSIMFTQTDGMKLGPITKLKIPAQIMATYLLIIQLLIGKLQ
ncbi:hypothetical protein DERF_001187 [Dermatophagoides farinae]|uniref:Uncharacterized protein n=1 Tax=Dermatophagoides farinae TaxID=6954 RepID=A0A922IAC9_DERFA|nr:hypothetical protein DERF_001187 [Dermatophagoides farinae]